MAASPTPALSPSSDERLWSRLNDSIDCILLDRNPDFHSSPSSRQFRAESECGKRLREGSELLISGFDSVSSSLSQFSSTLITMRQRASDLTKITVSEKQLRESRKTTSEEPKAKRLCGSDKLLNKREAISCNKSSDEISYANNNKVGDSCGFLDEKDDKISSNAIQTAALDKSKTLATSMVTKTSYLLCELKNMKLELWLMQERCNMLEEENIRLRESFDNGARLEDDDLIRLQLETLLAEKSRLANDNANLLRENQCLHQLIEYHKLISQDLSTSDEELDTHGMCLDFSSPQARSESGLEDEAHSDCKVRNSRDSNKRLVSTI
ncbi:uncharacterized protein LOC121973679 isoform X1 [Zingiber officinale]|uniref:uncharacterized protein LOC121973679 isoform X1 n=1 Tax=Zingiber officinale TaxID=94328 RepID=UPI001C4C9AFB|nr:uncharacterized protein LOC121973679 isoform X1 [Zingiber officinale]